MPLTDEQVLDRLRGLIGFGRSQTELAVKLGVSPAFVSAVLNGKKKPNQAMLDAVNVTRKTIYECTI